MCMNQVTLSRNKTYHATLSYSVYRKNKEQSRIYKRNSEVVYFRGGSTSCHCYQLTLLQSFRIPKAFIVIRIAIRHIFLYSIVRKL